MSQIGVILEVYKQMSRTRLSALTGIESVIPISVNEVTPEEGAVIRGGLFELLNQQQLLPAVSNRTGKTHDLNWDKDIAQLVERITPHLIYETDIATGLLVAKSVAVKVMTIQPEVDDDGVVCAWIYEEPWVV
jgi:hypothetical protein